MDLDAPPVEGVIRRAPAGIVVLSARAEQGCKCCVGVAILAFSIKSADHDTVQGQPE